MTQGQEEQRLRAREALKALAAQGAEVSATDRSGASPPGPSLAERVSAAMADKKKRRQLAQSCTSLGFLSGAWSWIILLPIPFVAHFFLRPLAPLWQHLAWGFALWIPAAVLANVVGLLSSKRAIRREFQWIEGLPFALRGYVTALQLGPLDQDQRRVVTFPAVEAVTVRIDLEEPVDSTYVRNLLRATVAEATVWSAGPQEIRFSRGEMKCLHDCSRLRTWFHSIVHDLVIPLHEAHGVRAAQIWTTRYKGTTPGP